MLQQRTQLLNKVHRQVEAAGEFSWYFQSSSLHCSSALDVHCKLAQVLALVCFLSAQPSTRVIQKIFPKDLMCQLLNELLNIERTVRYHLSQKDHNIVTETNVANYSYTNISKDETFESSLGDSQWIPPLLFPFSRMCLLSA